MFKRMISVALALVMVLGAMPWFAGPAEAISAIYENTEKLAQEDTMVIRVENVTALPGETIQVPVYVTGNPGFSYMRLSLQYDSNVLEYVKASNGEVATEDFSSSKLNLLWIEEDDTTVNDLLVTVTFKVKADAPEGDYSIDIIVRECYNITDADVATTVEAGTLTVDHVYTSTTTAPTCTEQGFTTYTCVNCGYSYVGDYVEALGHAFGEWRQITGVSCTVGGLRERDCADCGYTETETLPATGHVYESVVTEPTCLEEGFTTHTCVNCGDTYVDHYTDALGHTFGEWYLVFEPTCTEVGLYERDCLVCDRFETEHIEPTGHSYEAVVVAPTCIEQGYTEHICVNCQDSYVDTYTEVVGHTYVETVVAPTYDAEGYTLHTCSVCGHFYMDNFVDKLIRYGDVNGDGKIDGRDLLKLKRYLVNYDDETGTSTESICPGADVNGDGKVNGRDLLKLKRYLVNYDDETGTSTEVLGP